MGDSAADFDMAIVGAGFGGSILAMVAHRIGLRVVLLERGSHPRFAIGESTSPLMNLLIEELALRYDLPRLLPLTTFGEWQRTYPDVTCGLKRGFTYFHHEAGRPFANRADRADQLMVAASPSNEVSDTHWLRSDVDWFLAREAESLGVTYIDQVNLAAPLRRDGLWELREAGLKCHLLIDATGPRGFLSRALAIGESGFPGYPRTQTLFTHFRNVPRCDTMAAYARREEPPYPVDDAALHHVFDGGWMWVLRFGNGVTSAGVAVENWLADELRLSEGEAAWRRFLDRFPSVSEQFADAEAIMPFVYSPRLAYCTESAAGDGWAMLPSAAAFVDPLFSTGMPLTLLGIERLAALLEERWLDVYGVNAGLQQYAARTLAEARGTAGYIGSCYAAFREFGHFTALSMFYFAAASFSEMARRLDRRKMVQSYLALDNPAFREAMEYSGDRVRKGGESINAEEFAESICSAIEPLNIAGLADRRKRNWYPVDLEDVIRGAAKLEYVPEAVRQIIATAPWARM